LTLNFVISSLIVGTFKSECKTLLNICHGAFAATRRTLFWYLCNTRISMWLASWSSGQSFWLVIMRSRVWFLVLPWGFFLEGEDCHGDHGLGSLVELSFNAPPCTSYSYITIHLIGAT
jgi:hypothetical protein